MVLLDLQGQVMKDTEIWQDKSQVGETMIYSYKVGTPPGPGWSEQVRGDLLS